MLLHLIIIGRYSGVVILLIVVMLIQGIVGRQDMILLQLLLSRLKIRYTTVMVLTIFTVLHFLCNISNVIIIAVELTLWLLRKGSSHLIDNQYLTCMGFEI